MTEMMISKIYNIRGSDLIMTASNLCIATARDLAELAAFSVIKSEVDYIEAV